jgi:hypothetical protein
MSGRWRRCRAEEGLPGACGGFIFGVIMARFYIRIGQ